MSNAYKVDLGGMGGFLDEDYLDTPGPLSPEPAPPPKAIAPKASPIMLPVARGQSVLDELAAQKPRKAPQIDEQGSGGNKGRPAPEKPVTEPTTGDPQRFKLLTARDLATLPPAEYRVRGVLPATGIAAIFGPTRSGKSFVVLDLLAAIARQEDWFGHRTRSAPVLYVGLEGEAGIPGRVAAYEAKHGELPSDFYFLLQPLDIMKKTDQADLVAAARALGYSDGVLVLDTLNRAAPGADENDSGAMGLILAATKAIQAELGGLVLLVHHTGKDAAKGLRGHSSLLAALDAALEVLRDGDQREWQVHKSKDGADGEAHPFRLEPVEIGSHDDGEPITSCVVIPGEQDKGAARRPLPPKSGNQRIIWDALGEMFRAAGCFAPPGAPDKLPPGRPCIRLEDAIAGTRSRLACEPKRQTERAQQAITGLVANKNLVLREGWLWVA